MKYGRIWMMVLDMQARERRVETLEYSVILIGAYTTSKGFGCHLSIPRASSRHCTYVRLVVTLIFNH